MPFLREPPPLAFDVVAYSTEDAFWWDTQWYPSSGVENIDFLADVSHVVLGTSAAISLKPAIQFAATRTDRPVDGGNRISAGTAITTSGTSHFQETISADDTFFFRRGMAYKLTAGSFARAQGTLHTAFRAKAELLPATEIVFNPTNDTNGISYFPLGRILPCNGVVAFRLVVFGLNNLNADMECRPAARVFNDIWARGGWTELGDNWGTPASGDFQFNTEDVALSSLTPSSKQFLEIALAVRKGAGEDPNSRCIFHVIPAVIYG